MWNCLYFSINFIENKYLCIRTYVFDNFPSLLPISANVSNCTNVLKGLLLTQSVIKHWYTVLSIEFWMSAKGKAEPRDEVSRQIQTVTSQDTARMSTSRSLPSLFKKALFPSQKTEVLQWCNLMCRDFFLSSARNCGIFVFYSNVFFLGDSCIPWLCLGLCYLREWNRNSSRKNIPIKSRNLTI